MEATEPVFSLFSTMASGFIQAYQGSEFYYITLIPLSIFLLMLLIWICLRVRSRRLDRQAFEEISRNEQEVETHRKIEDLQEKTEPQVRPIETPLKPKPPEQPAPLKPSAPQKSKSSIRSGLNRTRSLFNDTLTKVFTGRSKIDEETLENLHESLFRADVGIQTVDYLIDGLRKKMSANELSNMESVREGLRDLIAGIFEVASKPKGEVEVKPRVVLIVGVNGVGKTTSIAKLAARYQSEGQSVLLGAADTYRAAAIDQLKVWGDRIGVKVVAQQQGSDPAAVAFDAMKSAKAKDTDTLLIDTAGRLHNKTELMSELSKIKKVISREHEAAPHEVWLVIDATTGQNAFQQVKAFTEATNLTGLIVTKVDGTAKGGVIIGVANQFQLPVRYLGVGESVEDLKPFDIKEFVASIV